MIFGHRHLLAASYVLFYSFLNLSCHQTTSAAELAEMDARFHALVKKYPLAELERGKEIYLRHCSVCHQIDGRGSGKAIPALVNHLPTILRAKGGKNYLTSLVLFGVSGKIVANGQTYFNMMPSLGGVLKDEAICAALNYAALSWGNDVQVRADQLILAQDVAQSRCSKSTPADNLALREKLILVPVH